MTVEFPGDKDLEEAWVSLGNAIGDALYAAEFRREPGAYASARNIFDKLHAYVELMIEKKVHATLPLKGRADT